MTEIEIEEITTEEMKGRKDGAIEGEMIEITVMNCGVIGESTGIVIMFVQLKQKARFGLSYKIRFDAAQYLLIGVVYILIFQGSAEGKRKA